MYRKTLGLLSCVIVLGLMVTLRGTITVSAAQEPAAAKSNDGYVGADGCKQCHQPIYDAWNSTKHQKAFGKLGAADKEGDKCIQCHVTGSPAMIKADGAIPRFPGVQCENCHGPGATHVEQAKAKAIVKGAIVKTPDEDSCTKCHSSASPHYKPFVYVAMKGLIHPVKK